MNTTFSDDNEFRESLEAARKEREALLKRRDEVEILIHSLSARQMEVQEALERARAQKQLDLKWVSGEETMNDQEQERPQDERVTRNQETSIVLKKRENAADQRNHLADVRNDILKQREKAADETNRIADLRDQEADMQDMMQNLREKMLDERECRLKEQEKAQQYREKFLRRREQRHEEQQSG